MDIPSNFDSSWDLSDVVLLAEDAEGNEKELHANRTYLSMYSSFFKRMFFSDFKEANSDKVKVTCGYETMKLILESIHAFSRDFGINEPRDIGVLMELYKAADYMDFPAIRTMCIHQMISRPSVEMAAAVLGVASVGDGLHDTLMGIVEKLNPDDIKKFVSVEDSQVLFTKNDLKRIYEWVAKKALHRPPNSYLSWNYDREIPDLSENYKNARIDCTCKWQHSNVLFKTKNSDGRELFSNKTVLAMVSSHFDNLFFGSPDLDTIDLTEIEVDVDYMVMKNILIILHHCHDDCNLGDRVKNELVLIYDMYGAASKEKLDIPIIRRVCVKGMLEEIDHFIWEMATSMRLDPDERLSLARKMDAKELNSWLFNCSDTVSSDYFIIEDEVKYHVNYISEKKPIVSLSEVRIIVDKLLSEYNK